MSKEDRHKHYKARGWVCIASSSILGYNVAEIWLKVDGSIHHWPSSSEGTKQPQGSTLQELSRWIEEDGGGVLNLRDVRQRAIERFLIGSQLPSSSHVRDCFMERVLTWDAPYFVGSLDESETLLDAALVTEDNAIPWLRQRIDRKAIVIGPREGSRPIIWQLDFMSTCGKGGEYVICDYPRGRSSYNTRQLLRRWAYRGDPRAVLPMTYFYTVCRAAVRREVLVKVFDACYERVRAVVDGSRHPERMNVIAKTPDFVIFGEPGINDRLERDFGV